MGVGNGGGGEGEGGDSTELNSHGRKSKFIYIRRTKNKGMLVSPGTWCNSALHEE